MAVLGLGVWLSGARGPRVVVAVRVSGPDSGLIWSPGGSRVGVDVVVLVAVIGVVITIVSIVLAVPLPQCAV